MNWINESIILNIDENIVEKDKIADYHSPVKVSQNVLKIITVGNCFCYPDYRKKNWFMFQSIVWKGGIAHCQQLLRLHKYFQFSYVTK